MGTKDTEMVARSGEKVGVVVPDDAKDVRGLKLIRVAAGDVGDHLNHPPSKIQNPKSKIG